jgi:hypothetical protein
LSAIYFFAVCRVLSAPMIFNAIREATYIHPGHVKQRVRLW